MSEEIKTDLRSLGACLLGFVSIVVVGAGALMAHSSIGAKSGLGLIAAPTDAVSKRMSPAQAATHAAERSVAAPRPEDLPGEPSGLGGTARAGNSKSPFSPRDSASPRLIVSRHLDEARGETSAQAAIQDVAAADKVEKTGNSMMKPLPPSLKRTNVSGAVASERYGVTDRHELMGRAAGPVYNFKGRAGKAGSAARGTMATDVNQRVEAIQSQLESAGLSADQLARLQKELADAGRKIVEPDAGQ